MGLTYEVKKTDGGVVGVKKSLALDLAEFIIFYRNETLIYKENQTIPNISIYAKL